MIKGKVATIVDERTIATNIGSEKGVELGMRFDIFGASGKEIIDPDTNEKLGEVRLKKRSVEVVEVYPEYSLMSTYKYRTTNEGGQLGAFNNINTLLSPPKYVKKYETFAIDENDKRELDEARSLIKVGDSVEQINNSILDSIPGEKQ